MSENAQRNGARTGPLIVLGVAGWVALDYAGPIKIGPVIQPIAAGAFCIAAAASLTLSARMLSGLGRLFDWLKAKTPTGLKGSAGLVKSLRELRRDLVLRGWGPYWGTFKRSEVMADYQSNALTVGPAGSGKGVGVLQITILTIQHSKVIVDFKGEFACVLADALRRRGETVHILNIGDVWPEILGPSASYNPLHLIADLFWQAGGLMDISDEVHEFGLQLHPEPPEKGGQSDNRYFDDWGRTIIGFCKVTAVLIDGYEATLASVHKLVSDRGALLNHALWVAGRLEDQDGKPLPAMPLHESPWLDRHEPEQIANFNEWYRGLAGSIADLLLVPESKTADSFLTVAQQALSRFNVTTRAHKKMQRSSFRFSGLKQGRKPTTAFLVADASRIEAQAPILGLVQWCFLQEMKRHPNKHRPVYLIADEATNFKIAGLDSLLTWGRGYGIRMHLVVQSLSAFRRVYGQDTLNTLLSETEIKQFLAGQREPDTLKLIESILGQQSLIVQGHRGSLRKAGPDGGQGRELLPLDGTDYREEGRAILTQDEIRRTDKTILIIRRNKPLLVDLPPIAAIAPFRKQIAINPFHGKRFLRPVVLRLGHRDGPVLLRLARWLIRTLRTLIRKGA